MLWFMSCSTTKLSDIFRTAKSDNDAIERNEKGEKAEVDDKSSKKGSKSVVGESSVNDDDGASAAEDDAEDAEGQSGLAQPLQVIAAFKLQP